jgi:SAM-dependent methyltransferase
MTFSVSDDAYDRFMGRYSKPLGPVFADFAGVEEGRMLDVGAGTGALTTELARRVGEENVAAAEPSESFVEALRRRLPAADVRDAPAEELPWPDDSFDAGLAQLVLSFVRDGPAAAGELRRVVRPGGVAAACMWDGDGMEMLGAFWRAAREVKPASPDERGMRYRTEPELLDLWESAGLRQVESAPLEVSADYEDFDDLWSSVLGGVGPAGSYAMSLDEGGRAELREALRRQLGGPAGAFRLRARAWGVRGLV